jgi:hypothetical protein
MSRECSPTAVAEHHEVGMHPGGRDARRTPCEPSGPHRVIAGLLSAAGPVATALAAAIADRTRMTVGQLTPTARENQSNQPGSVADV